MPWGRGAGRPYRFAEAKARQALHLSGNLKAMLEYVAAYGGQVELWIRSAKHPEGATRPSGPLQRVLQRPKERGGGTLKDHP